MTLFKSWELKDDRTSEEEAPWPRGMVMATLACMVSSLGFYCVARWAVSLLQVWWAELLVYATFPIAVTFVVLYRSSWHREITGAARTCSALLLSCLILGGEIIVAAAVLCLALVCICAIAFCIYGVTGGNH
jgi:hypothetical protein